MNGILPILILLLSGYLSANAQSTNGDVPVDERFFYAENKQLNQFFRRFNGEEDILGNRYYKKDEQYRDPQLRKKYVPILFDEENPLLKAEDKDFFIRQVTQSLAPQYLDFHGGEWMAEVQADFIYGDTVSSFKLFFKLQQEDVGSKWVLHYVNSSAFDHLLKPKSDSAKNQKFLHPLSHELDFTNLVKYFKEGEDLSPFVDENFDIDITTLFLYTLKNGDIKLDNIKQVKFHFWQIPNWYFEVERFNRKESYNNGLLISKLSRVPDEAKPDWIKAILNE